MKNYNNRSHNSIVLLAVACGGLLVASPSAIAETGEKPVLAQYDKKIARKVTHNNRNITQATPATPTPIQSPLPAPQPSSTPTPIQPPLPEEQQPPSTTVVLDRGKVSIKLVNRTGAKITYQAIGNTAPRSLLGKSDVTLKDLVAPVTITFKRDDGGLLNATGRSLTPGVLELTLDATTDLSIDKQSMQIQPTGDVFLN